MTVPSKTLLSVRTDALHIASSFFTESPQDISSLWSIAAFCEAFLLGGVSATEEAYGPRELPNLRVIPIAGRVQ